MRDAYVELRSRDGVRLAVHRRRRTLHRLEAAMNLNEYVAGLFAGQSPAVAGGPSLSVGVAGSRAFHSVVATDSPPSPVGGGDGSIPCQWCGDPLAFCTCKEAA